MAHNVLCVPTQMQGCLIPAQYQHETPEETFGLLVERMMQAKYWVE